MSEVQAKAAPVVPAMEKAYDPKVLVQMLKSTGLEVAEEEAKNIIEILFAWVEASAKISANPYDDMAVALDAKLKELALGFADKINPAD